MINADLLKKAEEKLAYAEFLLRPNFFGETDYCTGAMNHALEAGRLAVQALVDVKTPESPRALQLALMRFEEPQAKQFAKVFFENIKAAEGQGRHSVKIIIGDVKNFVSWLKANQLTSR